MKSLAKIRYFCAFVTCISVLLTAAYSYAEKRYIVDVVVVSLREGPAGSYRAIKALKTGNSFTVLDEENNFIKVETSDGATGWLPKQYTSPTPPKSILADSLSQRVDLLSKQNETLRTKAKQVQEQLALKETEVTEVEQRYALVKKTENTDLIKLQKSLDAVTKQYDILVEKSKSAIQLSKDRDKFKKDVTSLSRKVETLEAENTSLANKQALYWFLAGGGVFILGWVLGRFSCRKQKSSLSL